MKNILVVNGSPRGALGNTEVLVKAFLEGATEAGAQSETVYLKDWTINHCTGCFACWFNTPGVCIHKDDIAELMMKVVNADIVVIAVPLYVYTVTGLMKDFMDRLLPLVQPFIDFENGLCTHPRRFERRALRSVVLISNCGFPEPGHFSGLKETLRCWIRGDRVIAGTICCAGGTLLQNPDLQDAMAWYVDATRQAGREVIQQGRVADQTQSVLDRPLVEDKQMYVDGANAYFESIGVTRIVH